jgi:hypothetical protein
MGKMGDFDCSREFESQRSAAATFALTRYGGQGHLRACVLRRPGAGIRLLIKGGGLLRAYALRQPSAGIRFFKKGGGLLRAYALRRPSPPSHLRATAAEAGIRFFKKGGGEPPPHSRATAGQGRGFALFLVPPFGATGSNPPLEICCLIKGGGERGIRTPDTAFGPYNDLANRRLQPLGHLSAYGIRAQCSP